MSPIVLEEKKRATADYIALEERYGAHNYHPLDVVISRGEGVWVWDVDGRKYLDFLAAYSAVNQGHCHPEILNAAIGQARQVDPDLARLPQRPARPVLPGICELTGFQRFLPMNTGAEAVETALKAARKWGYKVKGVPEGKAEILAFTNNFHGRTITIVSFSTEELYRDGFGPFTPGFKVLPYGDAEAVEKAMNPNVAAVLVEPIQGEAGIIIPPAGYLRRLREITQAHNCLLMVRRDPVRPRPHRQDVRLRARRHPPRRGHRGQGALRRLLPGLRHSGRRRGHGRVPARRARLDVRRQPDGGRGRPRRPARPGRREDGRALGRDGRLFPGPPEDDPIEASSKRFAASGCGSASSCTRRPAAPAASARRFSTRGCSARRLTTTSSASHRR